MRPSPALLLLIGLLPAYAAETGSQPAPDGLAAARQLISASRLPEAREPLEAILRREPGNLEAALLLADVYHALRRREEAIDLLDPFLKKHPDNARLLASLGGECLMRAGELGPGLRALRLSRRGSELLERAVAIAPGDLDGRETLLQFYRQAPSIAGGSIEKALQQAEGIARLDPVRGAIWQSSILMQEKKFSEALAACETALAARPDDYVALFTLGRTVAESGLRLGDGEAALRRCLTRAPGPREPGHALVWFNLGLIAERRGDKPAARAAFEQALRLEPNFAPATLARERLGGAG